jgi:Holliday junction DNA helicase RuvA
MADRILVELRDRIDELTAAVRATGVAPSTPSEPEGREQALSALLNLGYPRPHAERALERAAETVAEDAAVETWVRAALRGLAR